MREIMFRGKVIDEPNAWAYGDLIQYPDGKKVISTWSGDLPESGPIGRGTFEVYPDTVGQFTGLHDRNGTRIFEGDILCEKNTPECLDYFGVVEFGFWNCGCCYPVYGFATEGREDLREDRVVVGNRWDTPELLGGLTEEGPDR